MKSGFYRPSGYIIFVFDPPKFYRHVMNGAAPELMEWATNNYDPPIIVANGYCWILSPGPVPRESDERYP